MKALVCENFGPPETLRIVDLADPVAGEGEALIEVSYAGLNFFDLLIIENKYQIKPPLPFSPAAEFSGRIATLGPGASGFKIGDRVLDLLPARTAFPAPVQMRSNRFLVVRRELSLNVQ